MDSNHSGEAIPSTQSDNDSVSSDTKLSSTHSAHWKDTLIAGSTVIGVAVAAAYASTNSQEKAIGITAWVAVAVVGASTMISTMKRTKK